MLKSVGLIIILGLLLPLFSSAEIDVTTERDLEIQEIAEKRLYPGGADEEDLEVVERITEADIKVSRSSVEREVYKELFNEELKESVDSIEEEPEAEEE